jgi:hypothetical protein
MKTRNQKDYEAIDDQYKESASSRPDDDFTLADHLIMTPARRVALFAAGFRPNRKAFRVGRFKMVRAGAGWERGGKVWPSDTSVLAELHRMEAKP